MEDELLNFNFRGVEPAVSGNFVVLPKGEYQIQVTGANGYYTGEGTDHEDRTKRNIRMELTVINHPEYAGKELRFSNSLGESSRPFLLNTLMCLIPEIDWQNGGSQMKLSELIQKLIGRTANAVVDWKVVKGQKDPTKDIVLNEVKGLRKYDPTVAPPQAGPNNPPDLRQQSNSASPVQQQAAQGVANQADVNQFLNNWPGGTPQQPVTTPANTDTSEFGF